MLTVLRSREFRLLWLSQSASALGDTLIYVAIGLYITRLTGNPTDVGLVLAAYTVPLVLLLVFGGVLADRLPRQQVMVVADIIRATLHGAVALLILTGTIRIGYFMVIGVLFGCATAFFQPAYTGLVPQTVEESDIQGAQALGGVSREVTSMISPALATLLVLGVGGAAAFALDAATFMVSAVMLSRLRPRDRGGAAAAQSMLTELGQGIQAVRERPWVFWTIIAFAVGLFVGLAPFQVLGPAVARQVYGSEAVYGWSQAAWGTGTLSGALLGSRWRPRRPLVVGLLGVIPFGLVIAFFAQGPPTMLLYPATAVSGVGLGLYIVLWETALAERIPPRLLSRVSAWDWMGALALLPLGYLVAGPIAAAVGNVTLLTCGGLLAAVTFCCSLLPAATRQLGRHELDSWANSGTVA